MSEEREYEFILAPRKDEQPVFRKSAQFRSLSERIADEFLKSGLSKAKVKIPPEKDKAAMCRGISKLLKKKEAPYVCRMDTEKNVWIIPQ